MKHYFMTLPNVFFPENRFCAKCGEYFTHPNHLHGRDCQCETCQQERLLTQRAVDVGQAGQFFGRSVMPHATNASRSAAKEITWLDFQ